MKKFYLFQQRGITDSYFCGNVYELSAVDEIRYNGDIMPISVLLAMGICKVFNTRKECDDFSDSEEEQMAHEDNYAQRAMNCEDAYGCEGVDDMRYEN